MGKTSQGGGVNCASRQTVIERPGLLPPESDQQRKAWEKARRQWRKRSQEAAKSWSERFVAAQNRGASEAELRSMAAEAAEELIDERIDRWRNDRQGYDRMVSDLGLGAGHQGITELISGQDLRPEFRTFAAELGAGWLADEAIKGSKLTPAYLMEQISNAASRAYTAELFQEVDLSPEKVGLRIFARPLSTAELQGLKKVSGLESAGEMVKARQSQEGLKPGVSDFWYQVRKRWQDGELRDRQQLAEFTAEQISRYG